MEVRKRKNDVRSRGWSNALEEGGRDHQAKEWGHLQKMEKVRKEEGILPELCQYLGFIPQDPLWTSDFQNGKIVKLCCFQSLSNDNLLQ